MKKTLSIILSAAMILSAVSLAASAAEDEAKVTYDVKQVPVTQISGRGDNTEFTCLFRSDLPEVPFVNVEDYFDQTFEMDKDPSSLGSGVYKYENGDYSMTIDAENDTISFDFFEGFVSSNLKEPLIKSRPSD